MEILFFISKEKHREVENKIFSDDLLSRQSIIFRDNVSLGLQKEGYYLELKGDAQAINKAKDLLKDLAEEIKGGEKEKVIKLIKSQEDNAAVGFGSIFK